MRAVILAGGYGTRISEESHLRPKPMVEIGGKPILWHIMKLYSYHGINEFIICCGYKGYLIKEYFSNYALHMSNVTFDMRSGQRTTHDCSAEPWIVTLVDTGEATNTGGRLRQAAEYLKSDETFCMTYGDGVSDVDLTALLAYHENHGRLATLTAVVPPGRFGAVEMAPDGRVMRFREKNERDNDLVSGGFFVLSRKVIDYIEDNETVWERSPMERLAAEGELKAYRHTGFWHPMDTVRDKTNLETMWATGQAAWKKW